MKQGSILSYLQRATNTRNGEAQPGQNSPSIALDVVNSEKAALTESQDLQINTKPEAAIIENVEAAVTQSVKLRDPRACITKVCPSHIHRLKSITSTLLPVRYSDRFFAECLEPDNSTVLSYTSIFDSKPVGWIRCRLEPFPNPENPVYQQIYVQALGVLAPYRGMGLGSALLDAILSNHRGARSIYAHVWETNEDALEWYDKHGFQRILLLPQYYRRLSPAGAWIVRKELT